MVYWIKWGGPSGIYSRVKRRVHFNQLKPFNGTCDKGQGLVVVETGPIGALPLSSTQADSDAGEIVLEDDNFPEAVSVEATVLYPLQAEDTIRTSQRERRLPGRENIKWTLKVLLEIFIMNSAWNF